MHGVGNTMNDLCSLKRGVSSLLCFPAVCLFLVWYYEKPVAVVAMPAHWWNTIRFCVLFRNIFSFYFRLRERTMNEQQKCLKFLQVSENRVTQSHSVSVLNTKWQLPHCFPWKQAGSFHILRHSMQTVSICFQLHSCRHQTLLLFQPAADRLPLIPVQWRLGTQAGEGRNTPTSAPLPLLYVSDRKQAPGPQRLGQGWLHGGGG